MIMLVHHGGRKEHRSRQAVRLGVRRAGVDGAP